MADGMVVYYEYLAKRHKDMKTHFDLGVSTNKKTQQQQKISIRKLRARSKCRSLCLVFFLPLNNSERAACYQVYEYS